MFMSRRIQIFSNFQTKEDHGLGESLKRESILRIKEILLYIDSIPHIQILPLLCSLLRSIQKSIQKVPIINETQYSLQLQRIQKNMQLRLHEKIRKRIEAQGKPETIQELCLDGIKIGELDLLSIAQIMACPKIAYITLNQCEISSLEGFPVLNSLLAFEAVGNRIKDDDLKTIAHSFPNLTALCLDKNCIEEVKSFQCLSSLSQLQHVEIRGNPITDIEEYRNQLFETLPQLRIVNSEDQFGDAQALLQEDTDSEESDSQESMEILSEENQFSEEEQSCRQPTIYHKFHQNFDQTFEGKPRKYRHQ